LSIKVTGDQNCNNHGKSPAPQPYGYDFDYFTIMCKSTATGKKTQKLLTFQIKADLQVVFPKL